MKNKINIIEEYYEDSNTTGVFVGDQDHLVGAIIHRNEKNCIEMNLCFN